MARRNIGLSFRDAANGLWYSLSTQQNMQVHVAALVLVLAASWLLKLDLLEWALVIASASFVLVAEMFNTAIERTIDLLVDTYHPLARLAKHVAAGAVLISALNAAVVGMLVFLPHLLQFLRR